VGDLRSFVSPLDRQSGDSGVYASLRQQPWFLELVTCKQVIEDAIPDLKNFVTIPTHLRYSFVTFGLLVR
jgi:hypothetical protein